MENRKTPDSSKPVTSPKSANGRIPKDKRPKFTQAEQSAEFERVAHEHGAEGNEATFNASLRKLTRPKAG